MQANLFFIFLIVETKYSSVNDTGCSLNIMFFPEDFKIFWTLALLCFPSVSVCVHTRQVKTPALQQNWQSSEQSQKINI